MAFLIKNAKKLLQNKPKWGVHGCMPAQSMVRGEGDKMVWEVDEQVHVPPVVEGVDGAAIAFGGFSSIWAFASAQAEWERRILA
jgi:hypothetical protein